MARLEEDSECAKGITEAACEVRIDPQLEELPERDWHVERRRSLVKGSDKSVNIPSGKVTLGEVAQRVQVLLLVIVQGYYEQLSERALCLGLFPYFLQRDCHLVDEEGMIVMDPQGLLEELKDEWVLVHFSTSLRVCDDSCDFPVRLLRRYGLN